MKLSQRGVTYNRRFRTVGLGREWTRRILEYDVNITAAGQTHHPKLIFATGAPTAYIDWGDGTAPEVITSGVEKFHTYSNAGVYTVRLLMRDQHVWLRQIDISSDMVTGSKFLSCIPRLLALTHVYASSTASLSGSLSLSSLPRGMIALYLVATQSVITGSLSDLPSGMTALSLAGTQSVITGSLSDLPSGMTSLYLDVTQSVITGSLSDLPIGMLELYLGATMSVIVGGNTSISARGMKRLSMYSIAINQAQVDDIINRIWLDKPYFTYATPLLHIGGTNPDPSGIYRAACPPTTGLEKVYDLVNGNCTPAGPEWTVTY